MGSMSDLDAIGQFRGAMAERGLHLTDDIIADGRIHRAHVDGDKPHDRSAWYVLHIDAKPAGMFGCNRRFGAEKFSWSAKGTAPLSPEERRKFREEMDRQRAERAAQDRARHEAAAARAQAMWDEADEAPADHPYLVRKGIQAHGARLGSWSVISSATGEIITISNNALLIPIRDAAKRVRSLQAIFPDSQNRLKRDKDFLKDGEKQGLFFTIGKPQAREDGRPVVLICEGFATGASLHECTGHAVIVTFNAGNLEFVAKTVRSKMPKAVIVITADNDQFTTAPINNPGLHYGRIAAKACGGLLAAPHFTDLEGRPTDFNDLHQQQGQEAVQKAINLLLNPAPVKPVVKPLADDSAPPMAAEPLSPIEKNDYFTVLGYDHESYFFFCHEKQQIMRFEKGDFSVSGLIELADINFWEAYFPGEKSRISKEAAMNALVRCAHARGIYDLSRVRGRGAWVDRQRIVFHHGAYLTVEGKRVAIPTFESWHVYELAKSLPPAAEVLLSDEDGKRILEIAKMFRWNKPASAALLVGWIALAPMCGALRWRPHLWITGGAGSGKSTILNQFVDPLMNGCRVPAQGNSTEAGIRQRLGSDALPVLFDESEQNDDRERSRVQGILSLIRQASTESEALTLKGTAGGQAMSFHIRSMFCLASIQVGLQHQADVERLTVLALRSKHEDPNGSAKQWDLIKAALADLASDAELPARLMRRSLENLTNIRKAVDVFCRVAAKRFGTQREGDQYGTLLAGTWSLTSLDVPTDEQAAALINSFDWSEHRVEADSDEAQKALAALMEAHVRPVSSMEVTVFELVKRAAGKIVDGMDLALDVAEAALARHGMRITGQKLLLSNTSQVLRDLVKATPFAADIRGVLLRLPGADRNNNLSVRFNGVKSRCIALPLSLLLDDSTEDAPF